MKKTQDSLKKESSFFQRDKKISTKFAKTEEEITKFQRFLFRTYCEELGWLNRDDYPERVIIDKYDAKSSFVVVFSDSEIIGGMRLVNNSEFGFPHEKEMGIDLMNLGKDVDPGIREKMSGLNKDEIIEITRFIGKKASGRVLTIELAKIWHWYSSHRSVKACFMVVDMRLFLLCEKLFIPLKPIGIPRWCEGSWAIPCALILEDMTSSLKQKSPGVWKYIMNDANLQDK